MCCCLYMFVYMCVLVRVYMLVYMCVLVHVCVCVYVFLLRISKVSTSCMGTGCMFKYMCCWCICAVVYVLRCV
jgi:hypothetical protein